MARLKESLEGKSRVRVPFSFAPIWVNFEQQVVLRLPNLHADWVYTSSSHKDLFKIND